MLNSYLSLWCSCLFLGLPCLHLQKASDRITRHQAFNEVIARSFSAAGFPVTEEPLGLSRRDASVQMSSLRSLDLGVKHLGCDGSDYSDRVLHLVIFYFSWRSRSESS